MPKITPYVSKVFKVENKYKVLPSRWRGWTFQQQKLFNTLYAHFKDNQEIMKHPMGPLIYGKHWDTIAWNAAYTAASELDNR